MKERNGSLRPEMDFNVMDVTDMATLESNTFDLAIDKSTIDCLLCGKSGHIKVAKMLNETQRVLKAGTGVLFTVSFGSPEMRSHLFRQSFLSLEMREIFLQQRFHYLYIGTKRVEADQVSQQNFEARLN